MTLLICNPDSELYRIGIADEQRHSAGTIVEISTPIRWPVGILMDSEAVSMCRPRKYERLIGQYIHRRLRGDNFGAYQRPVTVKAPWFTRSKRFPFKSFCTINLNML